MKNNASLLYSCFLVVGDFAALLLAFVGAFILRVSLGLSLGMPGIAHPVHAETYVGIFLLLIPFWLLIFGLMGLYSNSIYEKRFAEAGRLFMGSFAGLLFVLSYAYVSNQPVFPAKLVPIYGFILAFLLLLLFRNVLRLIRSLLFSYGVGITNVLVVGATPVAKDLIEWLSDSRQSGYRVLGLVGNADRSNAGLPLYDTFETAVAAMGDQDIHSIVQTELYAAPERNNRILTFAQENHVAYRFVPGNTELFVGNLQVELFRAAVPMVSVHQTALIGWGRVIKRLFDLLAASLLLVVTSPLFLLIVILNMLLGGDVLFRQNRLTRFNYIFRAYKFRTVRPVYNGLTPEQAFTKMNKPELIKRYRANGDYLPGDPRYGKFGNFLRRTSLDELPQLLNVLRGDLSLVGPRALVPEELNVYAKKHTILSVKSGLTGLAQVSGRRNISFDERRQLDMFYVQNWSFWLDIVILLKTARVIFKGEGAQ